MDNGVLLSFQTRMHSSRMRTSRSSSHGGLVLIPLNFPLGCWPGPDPPEFPPWVWAWMWSPSIFPLGVGLDVIPLNFPPWVWAWIWFPSISPLGVGLDLIPLNFPLGCGPGGGFPSQGGLLAGGSPSPSPVWTEWQTGAKILPCPKLRLRAVTTREFLYHSVQI